ncbi:MAG: fibronectin type III domain-containing protein [Actinobacteria bacterium]|nr:fibronectin type III domain-containing protein [Actinomycetota bacterium]
MPRFRFPFKLPVNVAATAAALVIGATSAAAAGHMVLTADTHPAATADAPGSPGGGEHGPGTTPTTVHREKKTEPHPTTSTTAKPTTPTTAPPSGDHHEPPTTGPTTATTVKPADHHEPYPTTSTTRPPETHEPNPTTSTTVKPTTPTTAPPSNTSVLSMDCRTGSIDGTPSAYCWWSKSTSTRFHHYRLTREVVGTPRQEIFTTTSQVTTEYLDKGLQPGANYSYIVEAYDADGNLIARSQPVHLTCCDAAFPTK